MPSASKADGAALLLSLLAACGGSASREELLDPQFCQRCHPAHYREWSGSMHAYAADDPVFLALHGKAQRETAGAIGDFCLQCHAPMALIEGDGVVPDPAAIPRHLRGVTCYFCHTTEDVEEDHNNGLVVSGGTTLFGGLPDPVDTPAHGSQYSPLHDRGDVRSSSLCGSCHDVVTPKGVHIERGYAEWRASLYAHERPAELQTCGRCHMPGADAPVADAPGATSRRSHSHLFAAVDLALTDWPEREAQRAEVERQLDTTLFAQLCVRRVPDGMAVTVDLENLSAGHAWPSGASGDRRAFVELVAHLGDRVVFQSGVLPASGLVDEADPSLWRFGDRFFDEAGQRVHEFWKVARVEGELLPAPAALPGDPAYVDTHRRRTYEFRGVADRITLRVRLVPIGLDILDALITSGDLDPVFRERMPIFDLGSTQLEWTPERGERCFPEL